MKTFSQLYFRSIARFSCGSLLFPAFALFGGCAGVTPMGGGLAGTDADWLRMTGNSQTGDFTFEARGLNQSRSVEHATETLEELTRLEIYSQIASQTASEAGDLASSSVQ